MQRDIPWNGNRKLAERESQCRQQGWLMQLVRVLITPDRRNDQQNLRIGEFVQCHKKLLVDFYNAGMTNNEYLQGAVSREGCVNGTS